MPDFVLQSHRLLGVGTLGLQIMDPDNTVTSISSERCHTTINYIQANWIRANRRNLGTTMKLNFPEASDFSRIELLGVSNGI